MMKNKQKDSFFAVGKTLATIADLISVLSWIGVSVSVISSIVSRNLAWIIPLCIFSVLILIAFLCKKNHILIVKWIMNMLAYNMKYVLDEWTARYEYLSAKEMTFRTTYVVRALQPGMDHIRVRFNWSGETDSNPIEPKPIVETGFDSVRMELFDKEYGYKHYNLYSRNKINKGDEPLKLGVTLDGLVDVSEKASPHILTSISVVTDRLKMIAVLPIHMIPEDIHCYEYLHSTDDCHWHDLTSMCECKTEGNKWQVSILIDKPVFGGKYILKWRPSTLDSADSIPQNEG